MWVSGTAGFRHSNDATGDLLLPLFFVVAPSSGLCHLFCAFEEKVQTRVGSSCHQSHIIPGPIDIFGVGRDELVDQSTDPFSCRQDQSVPLYSPWLREGDGSFF